MDRLRLGRLGQSTEREVTDAEGLFRIAQAYAVIGNSSSALRLLERARMRHEAFKQRFFPAQALR